MVQVKICGIKTLTDALAAIEAGADLLGFNFFSKSKRYLPPLACKEISAVLEQDFPHITRVGVFVNMPVDEIRDLMQAARLDMAQLHGDEPVEMLEALGDHAFKAVRPPADPGIDGLEAMNQYARFRSGRCPALLVDAAVPGVYGGSGVVADWQVAAQLAKRAPILLAGGLTPENVGAAVARVRPWGVDTASGVEVNPGEKDVGKMKAFIRAARAEME